MKLTSLWIGFLAGPLVWLAYLQVSYLLVPLTCRSGHKGILGIATIVALIFTLAPALISWRSWRAAGASAATEESDPVGHSRFMALSGLAISALSALLVIANAIPIIVLGACD